jgi:indolepyruvate ferredoxin oxidoreductase beta subunit
MVRALAKLKWLRRRSSRFQDEQALIERWLGAITAAAAESIALALEIAECARLIKGYGDTHRRGTSNFQRIFDALIAPNALQPGTLRTTERAAAIAALADPDGKSLSDALAAALAKALPQNSQPAASVAGAA